MRTAAASRLTVPLFLLVPPLFRERARTTLHVAGRHAAPIDTHLINRVNNPARVIGNRRFLFPLFPLFPFPFSFQPRRKSVPRPLAPRERSFGIRGMMIAKRGVESESSRV